MQTDLADRRIEVGDRRTADKAKTLLPGARIPAGVVDYPGAGMAAFAAPPGSPGALPRRGPLRTVRATRRGTRLKQAARALQVEVRVSCAGGRGAPAGRMRARGGSGHRRTGRVCRGG